MVEVRDSRSLRSSSVGDHLGPEENILGPLQVAVVELANELLARRRRQVLRVLILVADLDALDVMPSGLRGAVDRPLDTVGAVADDRRKCPRDTVVVLAQPPLVLFGLDSGLQRGDHVADRHDSLLSSSLRTAGMTAVWNRSIVSTMLPSDATGYTRSWPIPLRASRATPCATWSADPASVTASTKVAGTSGATFTRGATSCV